MQMIEFSEYSDLLSDILKKYPHTKVEDISERLLGLNCNNTYHNYNHIKYMIDTFRKIYPHITICDDIYLAIYFHDSYYNIISNNWENENNSIELFNIFSLNKNLDSTLSDNVCSMIDSTKFHTKSIIPMNENHKIFLDLDLAILGDTPENYKNLYSDKVALEYLNQGVDEQSYIEGRIDILETFLRRDRLFYTKQMYILRETQAKINIQNEIYDLHKIKKYMIRY